MDTGSPVIDDYDAKMPFKFTGTLKKVDFKLGEDKLSLKVQGEFQRLRREHALATQ
jgi:arylsulfatase